MGNGYVNFTAESIGGGDFISQINEQLDLLVANILDINKDPTAKRKVVATIVVKPVKDRSEYTIEFQAEAKLPSDSAGVDILAISKKQGYVPASKQMTIDEFTTREAISDGYDPDTGEVLESGNVTPFGATSNGEGDGK